MKKLLIILILIVSIPPLVKAQTSVDSVKTTINNLFTAMKRSDNQLLLSCFADSAIMQTIVKDVSGGNLVKNESVNSFAAVIASMPKETADERISFDMIKLDGALATVWTPYKFYLNGQFSHCGVNSFQLVRLKGQWKIQYLIDTRRKQGCE
jgi:hypothetical protein